jgi:hypothetical protein
MAARANTTKRLQARTRLVSAVRAMRAWALLH